MRTPAALLLAATVAVVAVTGGVAAPAAAYDLTHVRVQLVDLGDLGRPWTFATAMNSRGDVVGLGDVGDGLVHLFRWRQGAMTDLGVRGPFGPTTAAGVDDSGRVIGTVGANTGDYGFLWDEGRLTRLPFSPKVINNRGQIVGTDGSQVVMWRGGSITDLTPPGSASAWPRAINDRGQVLLNVNVWVPGPNGPEVRARGTLWQDGRFTDLGGLGGQNTTVADLNDRGGVTGGSETADGVIHPFLWKDGGMRDLGRPGGPVAEGFALNNHGQVAGRYAVPGVNQWRPAAWSDGRMIDLGVPNRTGQASLVDERGDVVGVNTDENTGTFNDDQPFLWRKGTSTVLPRPDGSFNCQVVAINRTGTQVAGSVFTSDHWRAVAWIIG
jgi:probable HAF family extracellular repeat protein